MVTANVFVGWLLSLRKQCIGYQYLNTGMVGRAMPSRPYVVLGVADSRG